MGQDQVTVAHAYQHQDFQSIGLGPEPIRAIMTEKDLDAKIKFLESQEYRDYIKDFNKHEEEQLRNKILG